MSYILDALRKSDQQRLRGAPPTLLNAQTAVAAPTRSGFSLNGWLALALIGAGMLIGWLQPWHTEPPAPEPTAARRLATHPAVPAPRSGLPDASGELLPQQPPEWTTSAAAKPVPAPSDAASGVSRGETAAATQAQRQADVERRGNLALPMPENAVGTATAEAGRGTVAMSLSELPASIRQEISDITISFHVYSRNPAERRVMIDNELLRQGETLPSGLGVEQITPDGVVINYKGHRIQRGVR